MTASAKKPKKKQQQIRGKRIILLVLPPVMIIFVPIIFLVALNLFVNSGVINSGAAGFIQAAVINGGLGLLAVMIAVVSIIKLAKPNRSSKQMIGRTVMIAACVVAAFFLVRPLILDIPYLKCPETGYWDRLEFDDAMGVRDASDAYYLRGVDMVGERHSFDISEKRLDEGRKLWSENDYSLFAKGTYLPHTGTLMTLEYSTELDVSELSPPSPDLPNDWKSFSIQINDRVYTVPVSVSAFLNDGWESSEEDAGLYPAGADDPNASYEWEWVTLPNDREQTVSVCAFNTTESTIPVTESTVWGLSVIYGNYDFSGIELRLPGGLMLGWSTREDALELYDEPNDIAKSGRLTYKTGAVGDAAFWKIDFDDSGILDDVMVHRQACFRSD